MIFESPKMILKVVRIVLNGPANDVYVCQNMSSEAGTLYTVLFIKQHDTVHKLLKVFEDSQANIEDVCTEFFSMDENFVMVFPYEKERPLDKFFFGNSYTLTECEESCINLVINFMTSKIPFPLMYLILSQRQLHISKDGSIYLGYQLDLSDIDEKIGERMCVAECAKIALSLLESKQNGRNAMTYSLINKKIERKAYNYFTELYKDIRIAAAPQGKRGIIARIKAFFRRNKDQLFRILFILAAILGIIVAASFITNLIFGDIPWLRIFFGGFKRIGTEILNK